MLSTQIADGLQIFHLPARVDGAVLQNVLHALDALPARGPFRCVLDFAGTAHVRFQDLQQFTRIVRERYSSDRPILLTSLSRYCREVVRFALAAEDWDLFQEAGRVVASRPALGSAGAGGPASSWGRDLRLGDGLPEYPVPSLN